MKRSVAITIGSLCLALFAVACRQYMPNNRYLQVRNVSAARQSTADAREKFDHDRHTRALEAGGVTCLDCHRFDAKIDTENAELGKALSAQALHSGSAACHHCHTKDETRVSNAPSDCRTCHDNLLPLRPEDHDFAWSKVHANMARINSARCESCHRQTECMDCHTRRDSIQTQMHDRNFRFTHGIEARANPMKCGSCHREDFCSRCHERGGNEADG